VRTVDGTAALLLAVAVLILINFMGRDSRNAAVPASVLRPGSVLVQLGKGFVDTGVIRQFDDAPEVTSVIDLTGLPVGEAFASRVVGAPRLASGARVDLVLQHGVVEGFFVGWMPAAQRVALGIALHPDRMRGDDWQVLPGVGPRLAERIEADRHKNGEFGSFEELKRVSGIGDKLLERWRPYFFTELSVDKID